MPPKKKREVDGEATEGSRPGERVSEVEGDEPSAVSRRESPSLYYERRALGENIILGMTGSVASIKADDLIHSVADIPRQILPDPKPFDDPLIPHTMVVATKAAKHFFDWDQAVENWINENYDVSFIEDEDEWRDWKKVGDPVLHIELRRWADILVVAPCSANTLAKMANGLCDDLLSCIVRAWDFNDPEKRVVIAPAMNTMMWESPFTRKHLATLVELGGGTMDDQNRVVIVGPVEKTLACGDVGNGAMAAPADIMRIVEKLGDDIRASAGVTRGEVYDRRVHQFIAGEGSRL